MMPVYFSFGLVNFHINIKTFMHKQAINHKQAIIGGGYLFTENACLLKNNSFMWPRLKDVQLYIPIAKET